MADAPESRMSFTDHLGELRRRLIICIVAILLATSIAFFFSPQILKLLLLPSGGLHLRAFGIMDGFLIKWRIALYAGFVIALPVWGFQLYRFVTPALLPRERKAAVPALVWSSLLLLTGTAFGYYLLWGMIRTLLWFFPPEIEYLPSSDNYIGFVVFFLLACGLVFLFPAVILLLVRIGLLSTDTLRRKRKIAYFILFAVSEIITPVADPIIAPLTFMLPLVILYEGSLFFARRIEARRKAEERLADEDSLDTLA